MRRSRLWIVAVLGIALTGCASPGTETSEEAARLWSPSTPPAAPELLGPGWLSTAHSERDFSLSKSGEEIFYTLMIGRNGVLLTSGRTGEEWSAPAVLPFSGQFSDLEPFLSADGQRLFFASNRPADGGSEAKDFDLWWVDRQGDTWGEPRQVGAPVNTEGNEFYPSVTDAGVLYYTARREGGMGGEDIWRAEPVGEAFGDPVPVSAAVNTDRDEFNAWISPDDTVLLFSSFGREDGLGGGDLYVSVRDESGAWSDSRNLGEPINSTSLDYCPFVSPDGSTFYFSSRRTRITFPSEAPYDYETLSGLLSAPLNGNGDIYWMKSIDW